VVGLEAAHARRVDWKQLPSLPGHRSEHLLRRYPARHQRRDAAKRRLDPPGRRVFLGELGELADQDRDGHPDHHERDQRDKVGPLVDAAVGKGGSK